MDTNIRRSYRSRLLHTVEEYYKQQEKGTQDVHYRVLYIVILRPEQATSSKFWQARWWWWWQWI